MTDKEKYDFIDHVVHLTLFAEDRLLNEHGGEYSGLEEDGIDSNEYYRIITERVINILKKNSNYMQEEPVSEDLEEAARRYAALQAGMKDAMTSEYYEEYPYSPNDIKAFKASAKWQKEKMMKDAIEAEIINWASMFTSIKVIEPERAETMIKEKFDIGDKVKLIIVKED